jgi:hypothetical protein
MLWLLKLLKKNELEQIEELEEQNRMKDNIIEQLDARLSDAIKIANKKKIITCYNTNCMDYCEDTKGCTLNKVIVTYKGRCEDYDDGSTMEEFEKDPGNVKVVINEITI